MSALDGSVTYRLGHTHEPASYDYPGSDTALALARWWASDLCLRVGWQWQYASPCRVLRDRLQIMIDWYKVSGLVIAPLACWAVIIAVGLLVYPYVFG